MNDFDYEVLQRKRLARQARYRVNGSKSKYCGLPSDNLTAKQLRERNGKVMEVNTNKPIRWKEFKELPDGLKREYMTAIIERYKPTFKQIAAMLGCSYATINRLMHDIGMFGIKPGAAQTADDAANWERFCNGAVEPVDEPAPEQEPEPQEPAVTHERQETRITSGTLSMEGRLYDICYKLVNMLGADADLAVVVTFSERSR